jgi:hypothetical protein
VPYADNDRYIMVEKACLKDRFSDLVQPFWGYVVRA